MSGNPFDGDSIDHSNKALQELLNLLASTIFYREDVSDIVRKAKVPPGNIGWSLVPHLLWGSVFDVAHRHKRIDALIETLQERDPVLKDRIHDLLSPAPTLAVKSASPEVIWQAGAKELILETGRSTLLDIAFLHRGIEAAAAVCKLRTQFPGKLKGWGTGFLIASDLVLTARHVLFDEDNKKTRTTYVCADFFYETGHEKARPKLSVDGILESCSCCDTHDIALVRLAQSIEGVRPLRLRSAGDPRVKDPAFIVQHPGGGPKQIGVYRNEIKYFDDNVLQYLTDTEGGSSGAPVFNQEWEVIGIHNQWIGATEADSGDNRKVLVHRNQGVRIKHAVNWLEKTGVFGENAKKA